ncbi:MAG TPA: GNAT family N-acetyltransferase [Hyphomicrobiales bacterium]|nr:GNAT family N-acetyltransferase [Hyphomicrobiales bacterium]
MSDGKRTFRIREAAPSDAEALIRLDERVTGMRKSDYWHDLFERLHARPPADLFIFLAEPEEAGDGGARVLGFVIGEVRAWEFGSEPCGWVFAIAVDPQARESGVGEALLAHISESFRAVGVRTVRTMISRDNHLLMSFFRSEGMTAGPYLQLEKELD